MVESVRAAIGEPNFFCFLIVVGIDFSKGFDLGKGLKHTREVVSLGCFAQTAGGEEVDSYSIDILKVARTFTDGDLGFFNNVAGLGDVASGSTFNICETAISV